MMENLWLAAQISLLGMSLVFGAILLLWGVLALLVRLTAERLSAPTPTIEPATVAAAPAAHAQRDGRARAAAAAVAVALAQKAKPAAIQETGPATPSSTVSAWQAVMRATRLNARRPRH
ncbi:MAG: OadG family transporter subunit [Chloroflexota bacterium]